MKYLQKFLLPVCMLLAGGGFSSCTDDPTPPPPPVEPEATLTVGTIGTNTAEFTLTTANVEDFAYILSSDPTEEAPAPAVLFGTGKVQTATDGENKFTVRGLEGETSYRIFVAYRSGEKFGEVITSESFTTGGYTQFLTIIETDAFDAIKFHIEVPEGKTIAWAAVEFDDFYGMESQFGLIWPNYFWQSKDKVDVVTESTTIEFKGYEDVDEDGNPILYPVLPSQPRLVVVGEVVEGMGPYGEEGAWVPAFDFQKYQEDMWGGGGDDPGPLSATRATQEITRDYDQYWTSEYHAAYLTTARSWDKLDVESTIEVKRHTIKSITWEITPDEKMFDWGWNIVDLATFEMMTDAYGGEESAVYYLSEFAEAHQGPAEVTFDEIAEGMQYRLLVINSGNEEHTQVSYQYFDFTSGQPTKDPAKLVVKGIPAPEGETASPWTVWFNIKCTSKDAVSASYLAESTTEFVRTLNQGLTYTQMFETAGFANPFSDSEVALINSDEGMNIMFNCWEDTDNRLAVQVINDEDVATNPDTDPDAVADYRSMREPDATPVNSELFNTLKGDWTLTADITAYYWKTFYKEDGSYLKQEQGWWPDTKNVKVTISDAPAYPSPMPESVYALYPNMTREQVDALYGEFEASSEKFADKTRGQNRVLCEGLDLNPNEQYYGKDMTKYYSPWDLFVSETYGSARITDDLFADFGPKWFLRIAEGDKVVLDTDYSRIHPLMTNNQGYPVYLVGVTPIKTSDGQDSYQYAMFKEFPVTVAADGNSFTIDPVTSVDDGKDYTPAMATIDQTGNANPLSITTSLKMSKGWTEPAPEPAALSKRAMGRIVPQSIVPADGKGIRAHRVHPRTNLVVMKGHKAVGPRVQIEAKLFDPSVKNAELERQAKTMKTARR